MPSLKSRLKKVEGKIQQREAFQVSVPEYEILCTMEPAELIRLHFELLHTPVTVLTAGQRQQQREFQEHLASLPYEEIVLMQCNEYRQAKGLPQRADVSNNNDCKVCPCARWCSCLPSHIRTFTAASDTV